MKTKRYSQTRLHSEKKLKLYNAYQRERFKGFNVSSAVRNARVRLEWFNAECYSDRGDCAVAGNVRLNIVPDESASLGDLFGDVYDPNVNSDIPASILEKQKQHEIERIERDGVVGMVGEYYDGEQWIHADSVWGFIGDDWKDSGYDIDVMAQTLKAAKDVTHCPTCKRPRKVTA